jgi:hypothetical protein
MIYENQYLKYDYKFYELNWRVLYFHNDEIIIEEVNFYNHNNQVRLQENLFFQFLLKIYAVTYFKFLIQFISAFHFDEIIIIAIKFIFMF